MNPVSRAYTRLFLRPLQGSLRSLRTQLVLWNVVALLLLLGGLGIISHYITLRFIMGSVDKELARDVERYQHSPPFHSSPDGEHQFEEHGHPSERGNFDRGTPPEPGPHREEHQLAPHSDNDHFAPPEPPGEKNRHPDGPAAANNPYASHLFYPDGRHEMPDANVVVWDADGLARAQKGEPLYTTVQVGGEPLRVLSVPGFDRRGNRGAAQAAYPLKEVYRAAAGVNAALLLLVPLGLLGAVWVGTVLTNRVLHPVQQMTQVAERIGAEDFSRRLPVSGDDEFSELATTFNGLLGRLDRAYQEQAQVLELQRRFTSDASHELKTPLTIIKGSTSLALGRTATDAGSRHTFQEINTAADTMAKLVQDLLLLARSDEEQMGRNPLEMLVREVLESAIRAASHGSNAPITLKMGAEELFVTGNEAELIRLFRNLLDNAVNYTPQEGRITVTACAAGESVRVTVEDTGIGIAPEHLPHLGERFYRVDASRTRPTGGTGLGLSICRGIVAAHRGTLKFESVPGVGTIVTVLLPCAPVVSGL